MELFKAGTGFSANDVKGAWNTSLRNASVGDNQPIADKVDIQVANDKDLAKFLADMEKMKTSPEAQTDSLYKTVTHPDLNKAAARNNAPVVVVHGTLRDKTSISKYLEAGLSTGHPTDLSTYLTIKDGEKLEVSAQLVSRNVNEARMDVTRKNMRTLHNIKNNPEELKNFFQIDDNLYGKKDQNVEKLVNLIPGLVDKVDDIMTLRNSNLIDTFSSRIKNLEDEMADKVEDTGFGSQIANPDKRKEVCHKAASELVESIVPRCFLVGHSMGGFVSYMIAISPKEGVKDKSPFNYDAGNGVSTVMVLSSPVGKGVRSPLPSGLSSVGYDLYERHVLDPMEGMPGMQLAMMNPFFSAWYAMAKETSKEMTKAYTDASASIMNPYIYMTKPGYQQISEGSDFIKEHVQGKKVPDGVTVLAITNKEDGVSEAEFSKVDESQDNAHNLDADVTITNEDLKDPMHTRPRVAHFKMADYPFDHWDEFKREIAEDPTYIPRILDRSNHDGIRWNCLQVLLNDVMEDKKFFDKPQMKAALETIKDVAGEGLPFKDSPSCVAQQILDVIENNPNAVNIPKPQLGNWITPGMHDMNIMRSM